MSYSPGATSSDQVRSAVTLASCHTHVIGHRGRSRLPTPDVVGQDGHVADGYVRDEAQSVRVSRREAHETRRWMDELLIGHLDDADASVVQFEGSRLDWWRIRRRLRRKCGVVASHLDGAEWLLRRESV